MCHIRYGFVRVICQSDYCNRDIILGLHILRVIQIRCGPVHRGFCCVECVHKSQGLHTEIFAELNEVIRGLA